MSNKQFINNLSATYADVRKLDVKKINLKGKNILEYIKESVPTIKHSQDTRETVTENDLWGQYIETLEDGAVIVHDDWLTNPNASNYKAWLKNIKAVQDNKAYSEITTDSEGNFTGVVEDSFLANIQTDMIKDGNSMFREIVSLTSFSGDLSNLVNGVAMFNNTSLTSFSGDLSNLVNGHEMFFNIPLETFSGDLSNLVKGDSMFSNTSLTSFSGDLNNLVRGQDMFNSAPLESFSSDLSSLVKAEGMFSNTSLTSFSGNLSSLVMGDGMFNNTPLTSFSGDLSSLISGSYMFNNTSLNSFTSVLSSLVFGYDMFSRCKLSSKSIIYIVESIRNITEEKAKYTSGEIPWVTYDSATQKYSAPFGFMEDGRYVCTYNNPNPYTTTFSASNIGKLTLGIDVSNNTETIEQQLQTFAEGCLCDSWEELKQEFVDKGWTITFQYGGTDTPITYDLRNGEQIIPCPIFAKLVEADKDSAEYCTEDASSFYNIDWGHDVTDYDQYQYFGSLLEACGYYGVIPKKYLEV